MQTAITAQPARCRRCGRMLTAAATLADPSGMGRTCRRRVREQARAEIVAAYKPHQIERALQLIADGGLVATGVPGEFRAVSGIGDETYAVAAFGCGCKAGQYGRACYHRAARELFLAA